MPFGTLPTGYSTSDFKPNCALAAYGRIWVADIVGDRQTVYFSRLLDGSDFNGGDSGSLALNSVFPNNDQIVALAAHNGFLIIFGSNNIAIYANPIDVTTLTLQEYIPNVGCIARDSVVSTGTDVIFLSNGGVRSLTRVIQEKSLPFRDLSKNVRDELMALTTRRLGGGDTSTLNTKNTLQQQVLVEHNNAESWSLNQLEFDHLLQLPN